MTSLFRSLVAVFVLALAGQVPAWAHDYELGSLRVEHPWARASIGPAKTGAAYLTVFNLGEEVDRLIAVETPAAKRAELHTHLVEDGIMKMRPVEAIEVAPGEPAVLRPGGLHVMMMGLVAPLEEGTTFPLTLTFEKAGSITIETVVDEATAMGPEGAMPGHDMKEMEHEGEGHDHSS